MWVELHTTNSQTNIQNLVAQINEVTGMNLYHLTPGLQKTGYGFQLQTDKTFRPDGRITWQTTIYISNNQQHNA